jgi:glycosyltransferase involved in cell wall biosynthesis
LSKRSEAYERSLRLLDRRARCVLVCSPFELETATAIAQVRSRVIPHFVEPRVLPDRAIARKQLDVDDHVVVTILGFIHRRKGHDLLVQALAQLPGSFHAVFAGSAHEHNTTWLAELMSMAASLRVAHRIRVTGYLSEPGVSSWLAATDVAVCPFSRVSASGSLSTWLASDAHVVATSLPLTDMYAEADPSFVTFSPRTPDALASAILTASEQPSPAAPRRLREEWSLPRIASRHLSVYRECAPQRGRVPGACDEIDVRARRDPAPTAHGDGRRSNAFRATSGWLLGSAARALAPADGLPTGSSRRPTCP